MKKSRRAFLADLLFLGGGLTAAVLLGSSRGPVEYTEEAPEWWPEEQTRETAHDPIEQLGEDHSPNKETTLGHAAKELSKETKHPTGFGPGYGPKFPYNGWDAPHSQGITR
jgi:hypothetical protein